MPDNIHWRRILQFMDQGNYFHCFKPFFKIMRMLDAIFLMDLMNRAAQAVKESPEAKDQYFLCTAKFLDGIWTDKKQEVHFKNLIKLGYIKTERRGLPTRRWVWIDYDKIFHDVDIREDEDAIARHSVSVNSHSPQKGGECLPPAGGDNKESPNGDSKKREQRCRRGETPRPAAQLEESNSTKIPRQKRSAPMNPVPVKRAAPTKPQPRFRR